MPGHSPLFCGHGGQRACPTRRGSSKRQPSGGTSPAMWRETVSPGHSQGCQAETDRRALSSRDRQESSRGRGCEEGPVFLTAPGQS